jgi:hypothetical protein
MRRTTKNLATFARTFPTRLRGGARRDAPRPGVRGDGAGRAASVGPQGPDRTFLLFEGRRLSFGELEAKIARRARTLAAHGAGAPPSAAATRSR